MGLHPDRLALCPSIGNRSPARRSIQVYQDGGPESLLPRRNERNHHAQAINVPTGWWAELSPANHCQPGGQTFNGESQPRPNRGHRLPTNAFEWFHTIALSSVPRSHQLGQAFAQKNLHADSGVTKNLADMEISRTAASADLRIRHRRYRLMAAVAEVAHRRDRETAA